MITRKQMEQYTHIPDEMKERFLRISAKMNAEEVLRNHAIAEWLGWYEKPGAVGIWYHKNEDGTEELVYNEYTYTETPRGLPFNWDDFFLLRTYEKLRKSVRSLNEAIKDRSPERKDSEFFFDRWVMTNNELICWLVQWKDGQWVDEDFIPEIKIKLDDDAHDFKTGLYLFVSQIVLTISGRLNELSNL